MSSLNLPAVPVVESSHPVFDIFGAASGSRISLSKVYGFGVSIMMFTLWPYM